MKQMITMAWVLAALGSLALAAPTAPAAKDVCTDTVDPYNPQTQRAAFFQAAGPDNEMDAKEFAANRAKAPSSVSARPGAPAPGTTFAQRFDRWETVLRFDRNGNRTVDWYEADAYRRALRARVLAVFDKNSDRQLTGEERTTAIRALMLGKVVVTAPAPRPAAPLPPTGPARPPEPTGPAISEPHLPTMPKPGENDARARELARRRELERRFDRNRDGKLDDEEHAAMEQHLRADQGKDLPENLRARFDLNKDGRVTAEEREQVMRQMREKGRAEFMQRYDSNRDGKLDDEERAAMRKEQAGPWLGAINRWKLRDFDADGDGKISPAEEEQVKAFGKKMADMGKEFGRQMTDLNGDGEVSAEERQALMQEWRSSGIKLIAMAARYMDTNGDGEISMDERQGFGQRVGKAMIGWMDDFSMEFDKNNDGRLDPVERDALIGGVREEIKVRIQKFDANEDGRLNPDEAMKLLEEFGKELGIAPVARPDGQGPPRPTIRLPDRLRRRRTEEDPRPERRE